MLYSKNKKINKKKVVSFIMIELIDGDLDVLIFKNFLNKEQSDWLLTYCLQDHGWKHDKYNFSGKEVLSPRLTSLYGSKTYSYSGQKLNLKPFTKTLLRLKQIVEEQYKHKYNAVLFNKYRDENDSISWHTDAEKALGDKPTIASLSLGATRTFMFREIANKKNKHILELEHGDLVIMKGETQNFWEHSVPKSKIKSDIRVNLTFRTIV